MPSVFVWHGITEGVYPWGDSNVTLPQEIRENKTAMIGLIVNNKRNHLSGPVPHDTPYSSHSYGKKHHNAFSPKYHN